MDFLRRTLLREGLHKVADTLDKKDLAFVNEVVADARFTRLLTHVQNGEVIHEEITETLAVRLKKEK